MYTAILREKLIKDELPLEVACCIEQLLRHSSLPFAELNDALMAIPAVSRLMADTEYPVLNQEWWTVVMDVLEEEST
jgi:hypothetical protein